MSRCAPRSPCRPGATCAGCRRTVAWTGPRTSTCPSLSPDGTRAVYKKRVRGASPDAPWRLYALELRTMRETLLAERRGVDDQALWSGPDTVVYALPGDFGADLWTVPADGTGTPRPMLTAALAPAYVG